VKLSAMKPADEVLVNALEHPAFREEWERTALARAVATRVVAYRVEHGLSQSGLAREMGVSQPLIARLEGGEHEPTFATLTRLARTLGLEFHIDITPTALRLTA
jgi:ribosome-binding protein aMBF1 (putative translation factor)